jgi:hypothetical protein
MSDNTSGSVIVGACVRGVVVGALEGWAEGLALGALDGLDEGCAEGFALGALDGLDEGCAVESAVVGELEDEDGADEGVLDEEVGDEGDGGGFLGGSACASNAEGEGATSAK